jgi:hypothetical protein
MAAAPWQARSRHQLPRLQPAIVVRGRSDGRRLLRARALVHVATIWLVAVALAFMLLALVAAVAVAVAPICASAQ